MRAETPRAGATARLADFCAALGFGQLDDAAVRAVRRHLLDTLGAAIAGSQRQPARIAATTLAEIETGGEMAVPGIAGRWSRLSAAYLMGASAHGLELDDGYRAGSVHPGAPVVPAVLAAAWGNRVDGARAAAAIAAGYEVVTRVAETIHPASRRRGFHNTPVAGVLGAAAAAASILRLDGARTAHALGIAASSAAGLFAFLHGGGEIKRLHPGFAAREGLFAALLARNGMTGPAGVLEIEDGLLQAFGDGADPEKLVAGLGAGFNVSRCYIKPYACCRHLHPALDAVIAVAREEGVAASDIASVAVGTYAIAAGHAQGGWEDMASAQMNYRFCTALAASAGRVGIADFDAASLADARLADLAARVTVTVDPACEADYPRLRSANVTVRTRSGATFHRYVDEPLGSARHPLDDTALVRKFENLATPVLGAVETARLRASVLVLETLDDVDTLLKVPA
ncbi:MmgE/PrpD family protein [Xanthobacter autotrophicus DSM 431]|uniref:MmgE/PrpD family protein n=1 Tax=Xanthobacter nonsaccharivorans TaxID=3119912 RepID=UPI00372817F0